jgi:hypothetical protein
MVRRGHDRFIRKRQGHSGGAQVHRGLSPALLLPFASAAQGEIVGALIIGLVNAAYLFARALVPSQVNDYKRVRLTLACYLQPVMNFYGVAR